MPTSFKPSIPIKVYTKTPDGELEFCLVCGGVNAMAKTAVKIDCTACGTTGYSNYWRVANIKGYYTPGAIKRWSKEAGAISYEGDASLKVDEYYEPLMSMGHHLEFNGIQWDFNVLHDPGAAMAQRRLVYVLTRKE